MIVSGILDYQSHRSSYSGWVHIRKERITIMGFAVFVIGGIAILAVVTILKSKKGDP
jgi:hypothetical protein